MKANPSSLRLFILSALVVGFLSSADAAGAQTFNPDNVNAASEPAWWYLQLGSGGQSFNARWAVPEGGVRLEVADNSVCAGADLNDCGSPLSAVGVRDALSDSADEWNQALLSESILADDVFEWASTSPNTLPTFAHAVPTETLIAANGDNDGNAEGSNDTKEVGGPVPGNRTCVFPAYAVNPADGNFAGWMAYSGATDGDGFPVTATPVGSAASATQLCTLYVVHTLEDNLDENGDPGTDGIPDTFVPVRSADGTKMKVEGDERNRAYFEQVDFVEATQGLADPDQTLAITLTRGLIFTGQPTAQITEADVVFNAVLDEAGYEVRWTLNGATAPNCSVVVEDHTAVKSDGSPDPATGTRFCYQGNATVAGTGTVPDPHIHDVQNVATHELGHFLGLGHPCDRYSNTSICRAESQNPARGFPGAGEQSKISTTTMFYRSREGQTNKHTVEEPDVNGLRAVFALPLFVSDSGGLCTLTPRAAAWGAGTWGVLLLAVALVYLPRRARMNAARRSREIRKFLAVLVMGAALFGAAQLARATTALVLSVESLAKGASVIVQARVTASRGVRLGNGAIVTEYTLETVDGLKGTAPATVVVPGGAVGNRFLYVAGASHPDVGSEVIVFAKEGPEGRAIVSTLGQGVYPVERDEKTGKAEVLTGAGVPGSLVRFEQNGDVHVSRAIGAQELPERMALEDYKAYLRAVME